MGQKTFFNAPLPFVGQKRNFAKQFQQVLENYKDSTVFVDLFGGSGLLSHVTKRTRPDATVIYNDYDNYRKRLENIPATNALLSDLREIVKGMPRHKRILGETRERIIKRIQDEEKAGRFVDYVTLSSNLIYSLKVVFHVDEFRKICIYNNVTKKAYEYPDGYLDGITVVREDWKDLYARYKDVPGVVFIADTPYVNTYMRQYGKGWETKDHFDVMEAMGGHKFVLFTSNKTGTLDSCELMDGVTKEGSPLKGAKILKRKGHSHGGVTSSYTDIMIFHP